MDTSYRDEAEPEQGPDWYWMITGTWGDSATTQTITKSGLCQSYVGDTYQEIAQRAIGQYQYEVGAPRRFIVLMLHLAPNTAVRQASAAG
ncbi:hypothetical protein [Kitasatospora fiedleri]|uniref:hypothetical protein n=1 Tax=Kitasatospora fiedleri TaxID=2991545 RepID=UPI00249C2518|nr:hypothetical protein [Kitasatospora fiedleri]